jgi:hypothetical protein
LTMFVWTALNGVPDKSVCVKEASSAALGL